MAEHEYLSRTFVAVFDGLSCFYLVHWRHITQYLTIRILEYVHEALHDELSITIHQKLDGKVDEA